MREAANIKRSRSSLDSVKPFAILHAAVTTISVSDCMHRSTFAAGKGFFIGFEYADSLGNKSDNDKPTLLTIS